MTNKSKGRLGEDIAVRYLLSKNYEICERNWTCRWGEIDIIAKNDNKLVFLEVKFRSNEKFGHGYEAISFYKRKSLYRSIYIYLSHIKQKDIQWRFDVISLLKSTGQVRVMHLEDVPLLM